ncbi:MAG: D-cysteine desulfhydrase family protein [Emcibacteraceae bacterium]|nr:D-cysteine desulfhydrase family protein [Emcibacteraceae bacterium]
MKFEDVPRLPLTTLPTSFYLMANLSKTLGGPDIYIKRDDVMDLAHGGNKTRKLEYIFADAIEKGADTILTMGGIQSNHVRQTVSGAAKLGLESHIFLNNPVPEREKEMLSGGNYLMDVVMGAHEYIVDGDDDEINEAIEQVTQKLIKQGKTPYLVPLGASNGLGSLGYMIAAREMMVQWEHMGINPSHIFLGTGSGGTHAGLLTGLRYFGNKTTKVIGISVSQPEDVKKQTVRDVLAQIKEVIEIPDDLVSEEDIIVSGDYYGDAYAYPTDSANDAIKQLGREEGIILDPVYTGKAMAGMIDMIKNNQLENAKDLVFLHTGGAPALNTYADLFIK